MQGIVLTQGTPDRCLRAYPSEQFDQQAALYLAEPVTTQAGRAMRLAFFSSADRVEMDRQGRVLVPPVLRQWAGLEGQVVVVGTGDSFLIYNAAEYEAAAAAADTRYRQTLDAE